MTGPTHLAAGLIIGHLTGDYVTAIACSVLIDIDHIIPLIAHGIIFKPKKLRRTIINPKEGSIQNQRNYLHSIFAFIILSLLILLINMPVGIVFTIAYAVHLGIDMLDMSDHYLFYPLKKINITGIIRYYSRQELFFASGLFIIWLVLVTTTIKI